MFDSKLGFLDYATFSFSGMVKEAVSPEESFSKDHWLNSFGLEGSIFGVGKLVPSPTNPSVVVPKDIEKGMVNRELGKQSDFNELMGLEDKTICSVS